MWAIVVLTCELAAALGFGFGALGGTGNRMAALGAGGVACMLRNSVVDYPAIALDPYPWEIEITGTLSSQLVVGWMVPPDSRV
jgi:hypothetical protein